ncbi:FimV/HubP family polar landmark protein [Achromobacter xylosoxidans]|uniref:FimV/HubP family polar landmark protein n=3 Tax=Alcaligenes xylosoxydans xylosoxydans TaxID=85698 RepID=UPI0006C2F110|nr:FimV/HubP family polar landmark protein [Achromobacter xylosoxidans]OMG79554.1 peptidoglycan-binding protein LysM [Achromobacter xylosoxidans]PNL98230.1 LysM peptidoglycan-binding domain-containing protein [Achromobacter xylosoxidans]CUJ58721.1 Tfp pilus assembly protein FimV [Achromobacter xylosoxidans]
MTQRSRQVKHARRLKALQWAIALAIGASACSPALAMRVGHSRVVSAPGAPLQALVGLQELTPDEIASLRVSVADEASWQRAGLKPPAPLASLVVRVEDGMDPTRKNLRVRSTQAPSGGAVDLLLDISSSSGQRQVQVSILVPLRGAGAEVSPAAVGTPSRASGTAGSVNVKSGDTLFAIAQRNAVPNASIYQMLVALWRANPDAFIQGNMNLVRAGQKLAIPDAATVRAVDPAEARRIFNEHAEAFARYRARLGAAAGANPSVVKGQDAASGTVARPGDTGVATASQPQDRVRLSSGQAQGGATAQADAQADQRASDARAMADAQGRVNQLQSNVDELNKAVAGQGGATGAPGAAGAAGANGATGGAGAVGASGTPGSTGAAGASGTPGAAGAAGASGTPGATGAAGASGTPGSTGAAGASGTPGATGAAGASGTPGSTGAAGASGTPGATGAAGASGTPGATGAAGASGTPGATGAAGASGSPGATGAAGASGTPGAVGATGAPGLSGTPGAAGPSTAAAQQDKAAAQASADKNKDKDLTSSMPAWLADNLLVIVTAVLALIAFAIAWVLRRAGARRGDDDEETYAYNEPVLDTAALNRKLDSISLDLDEPPTDEPRPVGGPRI